MPEDEDVGVREPGGAALLPPLPVTRLVYDGDTHALDLGPRHLGQPLAERPVVVVAVHPDQPPGARLEQVQQRDVDPVAGMHDDVGGLDRRPEGMG